MISEEAFLLLMTEEKQKRAEGGVWPKLGKRQTLVNEEVEDRDYEDNRFLRQPDNESRS